MRLCRYGAPLGGVKQDLVERLEPLLAADRERLSDFLDGEKFWR
jgi:hypothetical protein